MKTNPESTGAARARESEKDDFVSRKLIRPTMPQQERSVINVARPEKAAPVAGRKSAPTDQTHAEMYYFQKQIQTKTPMTLVLKNGESLVGIIEWYDKNCIKLSRNGRSGLLIYKPAIRYIYKSSEEVRK
jgi:host factor-I protein